LIVVGFVGGCPCNRFYPFSMTLFFFSYVVVPCGAPPKYWIAFSVESFAPSPSPPHSEPQPRATLPGAADGNPVDPTPPRFLLRGQVFFRPGWFGDPPPFYSELLRLTLLQRAADTAFQSKCPPRPIVVLLSLFPPSPCVPVPARVLESLSSAGTIS